MNKVIVLDTETTNDLDCPIVYDIGWAVIDTDTEKILATRSFVVEEVFTDTELMASAFFIDKIPQYWADIAAGKRTMKPLRYIRAALANMCAEYGVKQIYAHNAIFDWKSCTLSQRYLTSSKYRYFFPYGVDICDTLRMARQILGKDEKYTTFCYENDYLTKNLRIRYTAEIIYRFLSGNLEFEEEHTGLEDVMIEKEILLHCLRENPEFDARLWKN